MDLLISDVSNVSHLNPGISVAGPVIAKSSIISNKMTPATFENGITIEAWVRPANNVLNGPARIVTFSKDIYNRNFTLGQQFDVFDQRFRTSSNPGNGMNPSLSSPAGSISATPLLTHYVYTREPNGDAKIYIDGLMVKSGPIPGDLSNWNTSYEFALFNEITMDRPWKGEIYLVAIYSAVLYESDVRLNFDAGIFFGEKSIVTVAWDANTESDLAGYKIYYGKATGDYSHSIDVRLDESGRNSACGSSYDPFQAECCEYTLQLAPGTYYLGATAYDQEDNESDYSDELLVTMPR